VSTPGSDHGDTRATSGAPPRVARDGRGVVVEPLRPEEFAAQRNAHLVLTEPGQVRGNHYHERGTEVMLVFGPAVVRLRERGELREERVAAGDVVRFVLPPLVSHAVRGTGEAPLLVLSFSSAEHDPANPDVVRDVLFD